MDIQISLCVILHFDDHEADFVNIELSTAAQVRVQHRSLV
jgi:hypothetical protein